MTKHRITRLALAVASLTALTLTTQAGLVNFESRSTSWTTNLTSTDNYGQTSHAGKLAGGSYIDGMWSYYALNYTLTNGFPPSTVTASVMDYRQDGGYGNKFATASSLLPLAGDDALVHHSANMGGNNYGVALAFTNVLGHADTFTLSGSYGVGLNSTARIIDSWIYVVSGSTTTVLKSSEITYGNAWVPYTITLTTPLSATLQPGDKIYVALGGGTDYSGGDHYFLNDAGLTWSVPEPASLALLGLGGLALLRRRRG